MPQNEVNDQKKFAPKFPLNLSFHHDDIALGMEYYLNDLYGFPVNVKFVAVTQPGTGKCRIQFKVTRTNLDYEDPEEENGEDNGQS